jgi:Pro-kumamolisin, activation domain
MSVFLFQVGYPSVISVPWFAGSFTGSSVPYFLLTHSSRRRRIALLIESAVLAILAIAACSVGRAQQPTQMLRNHVRPEVSSGQAPLVGSMSPEQRLNFSIVLPLRNQAALTSLLHRLYDPSSPDYRQFLTVDQFTEQFGPTAQDYAAVVAFARANGLAVTGTPANRLIVPLSGTVDQINRAFNVRMNLYQHPAENRTFFSPDREPSLTLSVPVAHISGLDNFSLPQPAVIPPREQPELASVTGSGPGGAYLASDMRAAYYGGATLDGNGQAVGLLEFDGYNLSDVNSTFTNAGQTYNVAINNVLLDGATGAPAPSNPGAEAEVVLDIVQAIGMAPRPQPGARLHRSGHRRREPPQLHGLGEYRQTDQLLVELEPRRSAKRRCLLPGVCRAGPEFLHRFRRLRRLGCLHQPVLLSRRRRLRHLGRGHPPHHQRRRWIMVF